MLSYTNTAKVKFFWPEGSDIVEVHDDSGIFEAVRVIDLPRSRDSLKKLAQEPEYKL